MHRADVVFVKRDDGHRQPVWITREDGVVRQLRLHVRHDLHHFAVESVLGVTDGLWGSLVETGIYPGDSAEHLVAKSLTNALAPTVHGMRGMLAMFERPDRTRRASFDSDLAARLSTLLEERLSSLDESALPRAVELRAALVTRWAATSVGDKMTLRWSHE